MGIPSLYIETMAGLCTVGQHFLTDREEVARLN